MLNSKLNSFELLSALQSPYEGFEQPQGPFSLTKLEKQWLVHMMEQYPSFLDAETRQAVQQLFAADTSIYSNLSTKRQKKIQPFQEQVYAIICELLQSNGAMTIHYKTRNGDYFEESGVPLALKYSPIKDAWFVFWVKLQQEMNVNCCKRTPLQNIQHLESLEAQFDQDFLHALFEQSIQPKRSLTLAFKPQFQMDAQRFLHAFSIIEKRVLPKNDDLTIELIYTAEEEAFILSIIRSFGPHVELLAPESLRDKLLQSSQSALAHYMKENL